jgi:UDP-N-acetylglucosamine--N-acetylmuramyl-(pentapeptide) pyrophosphoryl-undecaprenol N-acetylglucosamine transferase
VLAFGGSLGATKLNAAVAGWAGGDLRVLHITGEREYDRYRELDGDGYRVRAFLPGLHEPLRGASLVVARAGGSIFEVAAAGKPSILIPSPNVTADHQTANARQLEAAGASVVIPDDELTHERLDAEVRGLLGDPDRLRRMGEAALAWARPDAAAVIADDLLTLQRR